MSEYEGVVQYLLNADPAVPKPHAEFRLSAIGKADNLARLNKKLLHFGWPCISRRSTLDAPEDSSVMRSRVEANVAGVVAIMTKSEAQKYLLTLPEHVREALLNGDQDLELAKKLRDGIVQGMAARLRNIRQSIDEKVKTLFSKPPAEASVEHGKSGVLESSSRGQKRRLEDDGEVSRKRNCVEQGPLSDTNTNHSPAPVEISNGVPENNE